MSLLKDTNGNVSSKRVAGYVIILYVLLVTTADGFDVYAVSESIIQSLILAAAGLIGIGTFEKKH